MCPSGIMDLKLPFYPYTNSLYRSDAGFVSMARLLHVFGAWPASYGRLL